MAISEQFIDELVNRTDLVDLVSEYLPLTQKGGSLWGLCPFHAEKSPSFHVLPDRQIYKCFGCGKGGGAINFVMEMENLPYPDAIRHLAKRVGLQVPEDGFASPDARRRRERILVINRKAAHHFYRMLYAPEGAQALAYLHGRGLSKATLTNFGVGFAPESWDRLIRAMAQEGHDKGDLLDAGLAVSNKDGRIYDRFRNRVIFPIIDVRGEVIGFGGRVMDDSTPKYLNSPDTPVYNKSRNLFALNRARKSKMGQVILTEGYMDTISLHQAGFDGAVASLGTALTDEHAKLLSRHFKKAVIAYDGDSAGVSAAQRAIPILERAGLQIQVLRMEGAKDPDEYIKTFGPEAFRRLLDRSEGHISFRLEQIRRRHDLTDDTGRIAFLHEAAAFLAGLGSSVEREIYGARAAELGGISAQGMEQEVQKELRRRRNREKRQREREVLTPARQLQPKARPLRYDNVRSARAEEGVVRLLLLDPQLIPGVQGLTQEMFSSPLMGKVFALIRGRVAQGLVPSVGAFAGELNGQEMDHLTQIVQAPEDLTSAGTALEDYIAVIQAAFERRSGDSDDLLRITQKRHMEKKAYMEDTQ